MDELDLTPHKYEKIPTPQGTFERRLVEVKHYVRIKKEGEQEYYLQSGRVFFAGGDECTDVPKFIRDKINSFSDAQRAAFGFVETANDDYGDGEVYAEPEPAPKPRRKPGRPRKPRHQPEPAPVIEQLAAGEAEGTPDVENENGGLES